MHTTRLLNAAFFLSMPFAIAEGRVAHRLVPEGTTIAIDEETARTWSLPTSRPTKGRVLLAWDARIAARRASGFREFMQVSINGQPVGARADRLTLRLVNKPDSFSRDDGLPYFWHRHETRSWIVVFAPDFETANRQARYRFGGHAYDFEIDITDLLDPNGESRLEIRNLTAHAYVRKWRPGRPATLFVRNLCLKTDNKPPAIKPTSARAVGPSRVEGVSVQLSAAGGFALAVDGVEHLFETRLSFPNGGWNLLSATGAPGRGDDAWTVHADRAARTVHAEGRFYRLARRVSVDGLRIDVSDEITNASRTEKVGLIVEHRLLCRDAMPRTVWMGGSDNPSLNGVGCPQNPTLFVPTPKCGLGCVLQDDVFRMQGECLYDVEGRAVGMRTKTFALDAGATYALRWSVYAVASHDYFDFINRVRADWGVNKTIHGPYAWRQARSTAHVSVAKMREFVKLSGVKYVCLWSNPSAKETKAKPYVAIGAGDFHPIADRNRGGHLEQLKKAVRRVHEAGVGIKVLLMTNCFLNSAVDESALTAFDDSWYRHPDGKLMRYRADPILFPTYLIYPTPRNSWGRRFAEVLDYYLNECDADGIYWDEMAACGASRRITFGEWDGHTAELDPQTKTIKRLIGLPALLSASYRRAQVDRIHALGKFVHANGAPEVTTLQTACDSRMVETKFVPIRVNELHLTTPLAYTYGVPDMKRIRERLMRGGLCFRSAINREHPVVKRLFPFTPLELHAGSIKAKERIVTCVSGRYGWDGTFDARIWQFDPSGGVLEAEPTVRAYEGIQAKISVPDGGLAILERVH